VYVKVLIGIAIGYLAYWGWRKIKQNLAQGRAAARPRAQEPEELVQDPVCGTFIPRKEALKTIQDGKEYFFCCEGCLKRFRRGAAR